MLGIDMEENARFEELLNSDAQLSKLLTVPEKAYVKSNPCAAATLCGIWCAKEAVVKAIGTGFGEISYLDIEIRRDDFGKPYAVVSKIGKRLEVSISHTKEYSIAVAMG